MPTSHTADGRNLSPPLRWSGVPSGTRSLVLLVEDPDAPGGTWVHWLLYDLPASVSELAEGRPRNQYVPGGGTQGMNDFQSLGYGGPCPPVGPAHRYVFKLYALDAILGIRPGAGREAVERAMEGHVVGQVELVGIYGRK